MSWENRPTREQFPCQFHEKINETELETVQKTERAHI